MQEMDDQIDQDNAPVLRRIRFFRPGVISGTVGMVAAFRASYVFRQKPIPSHKVPDSWGFEVETLRTAEQAQLTLRDAGAPLFQYEVLWERPAQAGDGEGPEVATAQLFPQRADGRLDFDFVQRRGLEQRMREFRVSGDILENILQNEVEDGLNGPDFPDNEEARLPPSAKKIASFEDWIENPKPSPSWTISIHFYSVPVPGREDGYALLALRWDDNWENWQWEVHGAVEGVRLQEEAARELMKKYAREHIGSEDGFERFLKEYL